MVKIFFWFNIGFLMLVYFQGNAQPYAIPDSAHVKITMNNGSGDQYFSGTRNMRVVLKNTLYRGGANNFYRKAVDPKKYNQNPLPLSAIKQLNQAGFGKAIYLYEKNFTLEYPNSKLDSLKKNGFVYECRPQWEEKEIDEFLKEIHKHINNGSKKPIYIHCWNGWHQSGLVSAVALMQFCDLNPYQALAYWEENTDNNHKGYATVKKKILNFKKNPTLTISEGKKKQVCPCFTDKVMNAKRTEEIKLLEFEGDKGAEEFMEKKSTSK